MNLLCANVDELLDVDEFIMRLIVDEFIMYQIQIRNTDLP